MAKDTEVKSPDAVSPDDVRAYLRTKRGQFDAKKKLGEVHGQTRVEFVEETGFNKTALGFCERIDRLSPEVRQDVLRSVDLIRGAMGAVWGQEETGDMFPDNEEEQEEPDPAQNIARLRTSSRRAAAAALGKAAARE